MVKESNPFRVFFSSEDDPKRTLKQKIKVFLFFTFPAIIRYTT